MGNIDLIGSLNLWANPPIVQGPGGFASGATTVSKWYDVYQYDFVSLTCSLFNASATVYVDMSDDQSTYTSESAAVTAGSPGYVVANVSGSKYVRARVVTGGNLTAGSVAIQAFTALTSPAGVVGPITDMGGQVFNVKAYGAKVDGVSDDTVAFNRLVADVNAAGRGVVLNPGGTCLLNPATLSQFTVPVALVGPGVDLATYKAIAGSVNITGAGQTFFAPSGTDIVIDGITIDGNSSAQTITPGSNQYFYIGFIGSSPTNAQNLHIGSVKFLNFASANATLNGIGLDTYGFGSVAFSRILGNNCDNLVWISSPASSSPFALVGNIIHAINSANIGVAFENTGNSHIDQIIVDSASGSSTTGVAIFTTGNAVSDITVGILRTINGSYPINVGEGGANALSHSAFGSILFTGNSSSPTLAQADATCHFDYLTGQDISAFITAGVSLVTVAYTDIISLALPAGQYIISGQASIANAATAAGTFEIWIGPTSGNHTGAYGGAMLDIPASSNAAVDFSVQVTLNTATTVYLTVYNPTASNATANAVTVHTGVGGLSGVVARPI